MPKKIKTPELKLTDVAAFCSRVLGEEYEGNIPVGNIPPHYLEFIIAHLEGTRAAPTVKPLVWEDISPTLAQAQIPFYGVFRVANYTGEFEVMWFPTEHCHPFIDGQFATVGEAKAATQAEYDSRIQSALDDAPAPGVRADTLAFGAGNSNKTLSQHTS